ncbi:dihydrodipicolinate synthase family protein [Rarobacter faecitabidus]|uniref:4-hydroxy-tetrahydrodipicolinate synthase n=1 Tax=Rarobacter faecitabidus TaxID=13243 RepID=A0A542ZWG9_RARFA|nr:dihydrodipicolinate synthase family protein [Rarobacter faecitabidus]TQL64530.1 4-hydroxy-tetrahydrodipicolinate synthase [Rarobacter faecitabidus]
MPILGTYTAYLPTPRDESGKLLTATMESLVEDAIAAGATSLGVLSGTGGAMYVPHSIRRRATRLVVAKTDGRAKVLVGISDPAAANVVANAQEASSCGADALLLQPVAPSPLRGEEVLGLYRDVASVAPLPIWVDHNPGATHYRISAEDLAKIATFRGVGGIKDAAVTAAEAKQRRTRVLEGLSPRTAQRVEYGFSTLTFSAQVLIEGMGTWHSALAGVLPEYCGALVHAATAGRRGDARLMQRALAPLSLLADQYGPMRLSHAIGTLRGREMGELPKPLLPLPREARSILRVTLDGLRLDEELSSENREAVAARIAGQRPANEPREPQKPRRAHRASTD